MKFKQWRLKLGSNEDKYFLFSVHLFLFSNSEHATMGVFGRLMIRTERAACGTFCIGGDSNIKRPKIQLYNTYALIQLFEYPLKK